jgi:hypothetical protein
MAQKGCFVNVDDDDDGGGGGGDDDEYSYKGQKIVISETICVGVAILQIYQVRKEEVTLSHLRTQHRHQIHPYLFMVTERVFAVWYIPCCYSCLDRMPTLWQKPPYILL